MKKTRIGTGLLILLLVSIGIFGFVTSRKADTVKSAKSQFIDPEDMVQCEYYYFSDHGSGVEIAQFDRMDKGGIYTTFAIAPFQSIFSHNSSRTVYDAGNIQQASSTEIAHLQQCITAGRYIP
jgi:hypothetical protein